MWTVVNCKNQYNDEIINACFITTSESNMRCISNQYIKINV